MKNIFKKISFQTLLFSSVSFTVKNPLGTEDVSQIINQISGWLLRIGTPIITLMLLWGAFQIMSAGGDTEKITKGRRIVTWTIIAAVLLLSATGIIYIVRNLLGV
ncbi:MAG: hypothetical protein HZB99_04485 [Candidatus Harrisonbacteria bacterium]|nr:hypothetical protein [Candidatus Harrisonbacteria bacterium]